MTENKTKKEECGIVTIEIPCRYSFLRIARQAVSAVCVHAGISEFRAAELEMAVDEVCSRVIESRAIGKQQHRPIRISLIQKADRVTVEFGGISKGVNFQQDVDGVSENIQAAADSNGLGSYIVQRFVDTLDVNDEGGEETYGLRLTKII
jgi:anti-sigma regulatory factor (Ser/Thr protein kinase)